MGLRLKKELSGIQIQYADPRLLIGTRGYFLLRSTDGAETWENLGTAAGEGLAALLGSVPYYGRVTRRRIHHIYPLLGDKWLVVLKGSFLFLDDSFKLIKTMERNTGTQPLRDAVVSQGDQLFYGEYGLNPERNRISILELQKDGERSIYDFNRGEIRHIHALQYDSYWQKYWIATGDEDAECLIGVFDSNFKDLEELGGGSQNWRTVSFAFTEDTVFWGTDNPLGDNQVYCFNRSSGEVQPIFAVQGPIYYAKMVNQNVVFGTTVEDRSKFDGLGFLYVYNLHSKQVFIGYQDRKDLLHAHIFGYGIYEFPRGSLGGDSFWVSARGFQGGLKSLLFEIESE